ncbi:holo-ACP synthase [Orbus hercynius]|uniref:citrate lyase holo-[acyl-carrier protein] synthase n=1 Tax=Orbus hercynius TaxID=593135 RepID=A0A495RJW1_9GAMM|nr:citrate lyase holo-[acyl-carrier protein] synthase [Orbus hercynius]RKS87725.1 holo-ACP synthase [Orbus hercynius]
MTHHTLPDIRPITLHELLDAKEKRVALQHRLLKQYRLPLISLTITLPGAVKLNGCALFLFRQAQQQIIQYYQQHHITCLKTIEHIQATGSEGFFVLDMPELSLKQACIDLEQQHPLGRLWDIDVLSPATLTSISRTQLGYPPRQCLICDNNAKICGRARTHSLDELNQTIMTLATQHGYRA